MSSLFAKFMPRSSSLTSNPTNTTNRFKSSPSTSSSSSTTSNSSSSQSFVKKTNVNATNNSFAQQMQQPTKSENLINNLMHTTSAKLGGKISKRKTDKLNSKLNLGSIQCFNLNEKEKFRQLIAQNCLPTNKFSKSNSSNSQTRNLYKQFIHSSPTK